MDVHASDWEMGVGLRIPPVGGVRGVAPLGLGVMTDL
jgi:hypothetical protein